MVRVAPTASATASAPQDCALLAMCTEAAANESLNQEYVVCGRLQQER
jgi:hypothetical protein